MRRTKEIKIRLTDEELNDLNEKAANTIYSREEFIRRCIRGATFKENPPNEFPEFIRQLRLLNERLIEIQTSLAFSGLINTEVLLQLIESIHALETRISKVYTQDDAR